jgi:hypothetical protein
VLGRLRGAVKSPALEPWPSLSSISGGTLVGRTPRVHMKLMQARDHAACLGGSRWGSMSPTVHPRLLKEGLSRPRMPERRGWSEFWSTCFRYTNAQRQPSKRRISSSTGRSPTGGLGSSSLTQSNAFTLGERCSGQLSSAQSDQESRAMKPQGFDFAGHRQPHHSAVTQCLPRSSGSWPRRVAAMRPKSIFWFRADFDSAWPLAEASGVPDPADIFLPSEICGRPPCPTLRWSNALRVSCSWPD